MLPAGDFDKRVMLQRRVDNKDSQGRNVIAWVDIPPKTYAKIRNVSGEEKRATPHGGQEPVARTEITIRYRSGIDSGMRVLRGSMVYNIRHVNNFNEANESLILTCDVGASGGI